MQVEKTVEQLYHLPRDVLIKLIGTLQETWHRDFEKLKEAAEFNRQLVEIYRELSPAVTLYQCSVLGCKGVWAHGEGGISGRAYHHIYRNCSDMYFCCKCPRAFCSHHVNENTQSCDQHEEHLRERRCKVCTNCTRHDGHAHANTQK